MRQTDQLDEDALAPELSTQQQTPVEETAAVFCFLVGSAQLAVDVACVASVREPQPALPIPRTPSHIVGFVVIGERAVVAVDPSTLLSLPRDRGSESDSRLLEVRAVDMQIALIVDRAMGVARIPKSRFREPSAFAGSLRPFLISEVDANGKLCGLLDAARLMEAAQVQGR